MNLITILFFDVFVLHVKMFKLPQPSDLFVLPSILLLDLFIRFKLALPNKPNITKVVVISNSTHRGAHSDKSLIHGGTHFDFQLNLTFYHCKSSNVGNSGVVASDTTFSPEPPLDLNFQWGNLTFCDTFDGKLVLVCLEW